MGYFFVQKTVEFLIRFHFVWKFQHGSFGLWKSFIMLKQWKHFKVDFNNILSKHPNCLFVCNHFEFRPYWHFLSIWHILHAKYILTHWSIDNLMCSWMRQKVKTIIYWKNIIQKEICCESFFDRLANKS